MINIGLAVFFTLLMSGITFYFMFKKYKLIVKSKIRSDARYNILKDKYMLLRKRVVDFFEEEGTGKIGIIEFGGPNSNSGLVGYGPTGFVEVEEIKKAGSLIKVKVLEVSPSGTTTEEQLMNKMEDWIDTSRITWIDGWQQKKRVSTLDDILEELQNKEDKDKNNEDNKDNNDLTDKK